MDPQMDTFLLEIFNLSSPLPLTNWRPICFAQWPVSDEVYRIVLLNDELPNVPPNSVWNIGQTQTRKGVFRGGASDLKLPHELRFRR